MGTQYTRQFKQEWILPRVDAAMKAGAIISEEKLISEFCYFHASSRKTALEILSVLENQGKIIRKDGEIWTPAAWEAEQILKRASSSQDKQIQEVKQ